MNKTQRCFRFYCCILFLLLLQECQFTAATETSCPSAVPTTKHQDDLWSCSVKDGMVGSVMLQDLESYGVTTIWVYLDRTLEHETRPILAIDNNSMNHQHEPPLKLVVKENQLMVLTSWRNDENKDDTTVVSASGGQPFFENMWIHVGMSWKQQQEAYDNVESKLVTTLGLYINGQRVTTMSMTTGSGVVFGSNSPWTVGGDETNTLRGRISRWGVWYKPPSDASYWVGYEDDLVEAIFDAGPNRDKLLSLKPDHLYLASPAQHDVDSKWSWVMTDVTDGQQHGVVQRHELYVASRKQKQYSEYRDGTYQADLNNEEMLQHSDVVARTRRQHIKRAMQHVWRGYRQHAWGRDELQPLSGKAKDNWGGMGMTLVDSLSTLWLLNMTEEFNEAKEWVENELTFHDVGQVSVFETTIRSLGGLLSAYDLTSEPVFLEKAQDLGQRLLRAFETPSGVPYGWTVLNGTRGHSSFNTRWHKESAALSELGTLQVEFRYLSYVTGNPEFERKAMKALDLMEPLQPPEGLFPILVSNLQPEPSLQRSSKSMGALGDSFYEYLLKVWLQGGRREDKYRAMYDRAMDGLHKSMVRTSSQSRLTYLAEINQSDAVVSKMEHLACFMGGNLALGAYTHPDGLDSPNAQRDLRVGRALAYTCYQMYNQTKTGIAPEMVVFKDTRSDFIVTERSSHNLLRPEAIESFFLLYHLTKDPVYRDWGWEIFLSMEEHCRTKIGYASLRNVNDHSDGHEDKMESFFLAETLKYLYLLHDPDMKLDVLNEHVFNTEAHPLRMLDRL